MPVLECSGPTNIVFERGHPDVRADVRPGTGHAVEQHVVVPEGVVAVRPAPLCVVVYEVVRQLVLERGVDL